MRTSIHSEVTGNRPAFPHAMALTAYFVISPAIGFLATVALRISGFVQPGCAERTSARLDASIEASGPHVYILMDGERS